MKRRSRRRFQRAESACTKSISDSVPHSHSYARGSEWAGDMYVGIFVSQTHKSAERAAELHMAAITETSCSKNTCSDGHKFPQSRREKSTSSRAIPFTKYRSKVPGLQGEQPDRMGVTLTSSPLKPPGLLLTKSNQSPVLSKSICAWFLLDGYTLMC